MSKIYAEAAVEAAKELQKNNKLSPEKVWLEKLSLLTHSEESIRKGCPKTTFLFLCSEGYIKDVSINLQMNKTSKNCHYAQQMIDYIKEKNGKIGSKKELWENVKHPEKANNENGQTSVIFGLLKSDLLNY